MKTAGYILGLCQLTEVATYNAERYMLCIGIQYAYFDVSQDLESKDRVRVQASTWAFVCYLALRRLFSEV